MQCQNFSNLFFTAQDFLENRYKSGEVVVRMINRKVKDTQDVTMENGREKQKEKESKRKKSPKDKQKSIKNDKKEKEEEEDKTTSKDSSKLFERFAKKDFKAKRDDFVTVCYGLPSFCVSK